MPCVSILWATFVLAFFWMNMTLCLCGHTSWLFSTVIIPAFGFSCYIFLAWARRGLFKQIMAALPFSLIVLMLIKNVSDIFFFGHNPLF